MVMQNISKIPKKTRLVFPALKVHGAHLPQDPSQHKDKKFYGVFAMDINHLLAWLEWVGIEYTELFINGITNANDRAKLIIGGTQGQKGVKLFLNPNYNKAPESQLHKSKNFGAGQR
jgi:hypothetical protein